MKRLKTIAGSLAALGIAGVVLLGVWAYRDRIWPRSSTAVDVMSGRTGNRQDKQTVLEISAAARKNLGLVSMPARPQNHWRSVLIPGQVTDRPGVSDRGVTSPAVGVVTAIHAFPGDTIRPGEALFTLRLFSEYLQSTQTQLFKAKQETAIVQAEIDRLSGLAKVGAISKSKMIELASEITRQNTLIQSARQELLTRGLKPEQVQQIESGTFVSTVEVVAPPVRAVQPSSDGETTAAPPVSPNSESAPGDGIDYEVQELVVDLGQQVQAGQLLANLSNHQSLYVIGHAFKREAIFLEQAAQEQRPIDIEFADDVAGGWPARQQTFEIRHLANSIDPESRTFDFFIPLTNQSRSFHKDGNTFVVWRFRPGQRARIHVPVEEFQDVFVLPSEAVVRDGPEAYVFRQNGDLFKQIPVNVLHEDRRQIVIANDGSITPGTYLAQSGAASLNRVLRSQSASGEQPGLHVHPDGTVHAAH